MIRGIAVAVLACGAPLHALAFPCTVMNADGFEACLEQVNDGEAITVVPRLKVNIPNSVQIPKSITIRSTDPTQDFTFVHQPYASEEVPPRLPFQDGGYPAPAGSMFAITSGATVTIQNAQIELYDSHPSYPSITLSRAFRVQDGDLILDDVTLEGVMAAPSTEIDSGAGFLAEVVGRNSSLTIRSGAFREIVAPEYPGAVLYATEQAKIVIAGPARFEGCQGRKGGVGLIKRGSSIEIVRDEGARAASFIGNNAVDSGGAFHVEISEPDRSTLYAAGAVFQGNSAGTGGSIQATDADITLDDVTFDGSFAESGGGAIYSTQGTALLTRVTAINNRTDTTGGVVLASGGEGMSIVDSVFIGNTARDAGAAIHAVNRAGNDAIFGTRICSNRTVARSGGEQIRIEGVGQPFSMSGTLVDGNNEGGGPAVWIAARSYTITNSTFVRTPSHAVELVSGTGDFVRNVIAWSGGSSGVLATSASSVPTNLDQNIWYDPSGSWTSPVMQDQTLIGPGMRSVEGDLKLTGTLGDGELGGPCDISPHHLRPDSPLVLGDWTAADAYLDVAGFLGGAHYATSKRLDSWDNTTAGDEDEVLPIWDCDDTNDDLGVFVEQYYDADNDGYPGTFVEGYPCTRPPENSIDSEDCDDGNNQVFEGCDDDVDTDTAQAVVPYRYGSSCACNGSVGPTGVFWVAAAALFFVSRRRRLG